MTNILVRELLVLATKAHGQQTALTVATRFGFSLLHDRVLQPSQSLHFDSNGLPVAEPALRFAG